MGGSHIIKAIAAAQALPHFTRQMLDEMNAQHAKEFAGCTKPETIALHGKGAAASAAAVRGLSDAELAMTGAEELVKGVTAETGSRLRLTWAGRAAAESTPRNQTGSPRPPRAGEERLGLGRTSADVRHFL